MTTIAITLKAATQKLAKTSETARLDAELLLTKTLNCSRSHLIAYDQQKLSAEQLKQFHALIAKRATHYPMAYLLGHKEFWSLDLFITEDVLVPRPETELLVELILKQFGPFEKISVVDLGTGSGAIALALAHEKPHWRIIATDQSEKALAVAKSNAEQLKITNIEFRLGHWCQALPEDFRADIIVSNPPYLAANDPHLIASEISHEPRSALVADHQGLAAYEEIAATAKKFLKHSGWIFFEHGAEQSQALQQILTQQNYDHITCHRDMASLMRVTSALNYP